MEGVVVLHETLRESHRKKMSRIIFKIDFKKAYGNVNWTFPHQTLRMKGFSQKWCSWIQSFVQGGNVGIKVNDQMGPSKHEKAFGKVIHCSKYYLIWW